MGGCVSCEYSSSYTFTKVRVVHLNGYVEDFDQPITVSQVTGTPSKHFICTAPQLLLTSSSTPLKADYELQPGLYFMLPFSVLQPDVSPMDLASLSKKLTLVATRPQTARCRARIKTTRQQQQQQRGVMSGPLWESSPERSPGRLFAVMEEREGVEYGERILQYRSRRTWKPILDTIGEKSFNRGSESDLRERDLSDLCNKILD